MQPNTDSLLFSIVRQLINHHLDDTEFRLSDEILKDLWTIVWKFSQSK